jgi:hypothetical protein
MKKYELVTTDFIELSGGKVFRIRALINFETVNGIKIKAGDLGGYVEGEKNLSHQGKAWVGCEARVYDWTCQENHTK